MSETDKVEIEMISKAVTVLKWFCLMTSAIREIILSGLQKLVHHRFLTWWELFSFTQMICLHQSLTCFILILPHSSCILPAVLKLLIAAWYPTMQYQASGFYLIGVPLSAALWKSAIMQAVQRSMTDFCIITCIQGGIQKMMVCIISCRYTDTISDSWFAVMKLIKVLILLINSKHFYASWKNTAYFTFCIKGGHV